MKIAYIAHPIGGNVLHNLDKIKRIAREINLTEKETVPFVPYYLDCHAMNDADPKERKRGIRNNHEFFSRQTMDELRLYGDKISYGMKGEIELASFHEIPVRPMTEKLKMELIEFQREIGFKLEILPT